MIAKHLLSELCLWPLAIFVLVFAAFWLGFLRLEKETDNLQSDD